MTLLKQRMTLLSKSSIFLTRQISFFMGEPNAPRNDILHHLKYGLAHFHIVNNPLPSISLTDFQLCPSPSNTHRFFARIGPSLGITSSASRKIENYSVQKVAGDGRCMFRALVKGMALNKGVSLHSREERDSADELRMAVKEVICESGSERRQYEEALIAITVDEPLKRYCQRIERSDFWGGESELLVLSKLCNQPIIVYIPEHEHTRGGRGSGFIPIAEYGAEFRRRTRSGNPRKVVRLVYSGKNHYDLLV